MFRIIYAQFSRVLRVAALLVLVASLVACDAGNTPGPAAGATATEGRAATGPTVGGASGSKIIVVATTTQIRSMTEAVVGEEASVLTILKAGADPHEYEPVPSDVQAISQSALVL